LTIVKWCRVRCSEVVAWRQFLLNPGICGEGVEVWWQRQLFFRVLFPGLVVAAVDGAIEFI
jgi:hypothetical protein